MSGKNSEFEIVFSPQAVKDLKKLDKPAQVCIKTAIQKLAWFPPTVRIIKLKGGNNTEMRLRVGKWRVIFEYSFSEKCVRILRIKHRRDAYKNN